MFGRLRIGMSAVSPQLMNAPVRVRDCQMYQMPVDGRKTAGSAWPSPS